MFEMKSLFWSILGAPASGKSYFLASMTWKLRNVLPKCFAMSFGDADPISNHCLNEYEELQFLNANPSQVVAIRKTELQGELYDTVLFGDQTISYPRPFAFSLRPMDHHRYVGSAKQLARVLCLYDNAGEHFMPGHDTVGSPVTRHLAQSQVLLFLFDPIQDPRFREACLRANVPKRSAEEPLKKVPMRLPDGYDRADPQLLDKARTFRQETILHEAADRIRRHSGLAHNEKLSRPLVVVVSKFDAWSCLLNEEELRPPWVQRKTGDSCLLDLDYIDHISKQVRSLLWELSPEIVSAAESFAKQVYYLPVSATGGPPEKDPNTGMLGFRPQNIKPIWVEVPMLYALCRWMRGMVPHFSAKSTLSRGLTPNAASTPANSSNND